MHCWSTAVIFFSTMIAANDASPSCRQRYGRGRLHRITVIIAVFFNAVAIQSPIFHFLSTVSKLWIVWVFFSHCLSLSRYICSLYWLSSFLPDVFEWIYVCVRLYICVSLCVSFPSQALHNMFRDYHECSWKWNFVKLTRNCNTTACSINKNKANENLIHFKLHSFLHMFYVNIFYTLNCMPAKKYTWTQCTEQLGRITKELCEHSLCMENGWGERWYSSEKNWNTNNVLGK